MAWREVSVMNQRIEFVTLALAEGTNISELCQRFGISRKTGYKFLNRYKEQGKEGLQDCSRRPVNSPNKTSCEVEQLVLELRDKHPAWGGRKLKRRLEDLGHSGIPSPSTITSILRRNERISSAESQRHKPWKRFEAQRPNDLWQMDFKGYFPIRDGQCYPLTVVDDNSRYALCIGACSNEQGQSVVKHLREVFIRYGMPSSMLMDNGNPWGGGRRRKYTSFGVWLMRLGIKVIHSKPRHPQTLGKDERFHRTMNAELIMDCKGKSKDECQKLFDRWRVIYNTQRPHQCLNMNVPSKCYRISEKEYPQQFEEIEYSPSDLVRKVQFGGIVYFRNREFKVGKAFTGQRVALRETDKDGKYNVYFCNQKISKISLI